MASKQITIRDYNTQIPGKLSEDGITWIFPQINSVNSHGKRTEWAIYVRAMISDVGNRTDVMCSRGESIATFVPIITAEYNLLDNKTTSITFNGKVVELLGWYKVDSKVSDGKLRTSVPTYVTGGKNLKASSATTPFCQALRDAYSQHNKQIKKAVKDVQGDSVRYPPMLAQKMDVEKLHTQLAVEPVFVQRKYNGVRCVTTLGYDGDVPVVIMYSRTGTIYPGFAHIKDELLHVLSEYWTAGKKIYLDGEIYKHGVALQDISGSARKEMSDADVKCNYMVYDCFIPGEELKYSERRALLDEIFDVFDFEYAMQVATYSASTVEEINTLYDGFLKEGFEGAMIRFNGLYKYSYNAHHSSVLLKMKPTNDAEYEIVRWEIGLKGKALGALMIVCKTADRTTDGKDVVSNTGKDAIIPGIEFPVTPAMEIPDRVALANKMKTEIAPGLTYFDANYKGKPLIVYFDELSKDKVPQRARTKMEIRTWE